MIKYLLLCLVFSVNAIETFNAKVVGVNDGDTITVLTAENEQTKIRLNAIDCPESKQDFGQKAKQVTSDLCFGKMVRVEKSGEDRYGRTLAFVFVGDVCVNMELLKKGMAWHYKKYNQDPELAKLEDMAREKKVGLWSMANPVPPWEWRKAH